MVEPVYLEADQLKAKIDHYLGMQSQMVIYSPRSARLEYRSPTGIFLFKINIKCFDDPNGGWKIAGYGQVLEGSWYDLLELHREV